MSSLDRKTSGPVLGDTIATIACSIITLGLLAVAGAWVLGYKLAGRETSGMLGQLLAGDAVWPAEATYLLAGVCVGLIALSVCVALLRRKQRPEKDAPRIDAAAEHMAGRREVRSLTAKGREKSARRALIETPLLPMMGCNVNGGDMLYVGPEMITTLIAGPRGGKSSSFSKPVICEHRGPVVVTENKPNLAAETRHFREQFGRSWVFDPQRIAREPVSWYWEPVSSYVVRGGDPMLTDMRALKLAQRFSFSTGFGKGKDYFDISAQGLVGALILAAAVMNYDIFAVRTWLSNPNDRTPANALGGAQYHEAAAALNGIMSLTSKQRDGIYGTADTMTNFLMYRAVREWVTPGNRRVEFNPAAFVRSAGDTLYLLSREGQGSMGPIVSALTVAVAEAAEDYSDEQGGRLKTPIALVLDEVANVCKWAELPQVVSHYGSKGILVFAIFQSWSQGVNVWGDHGMKALWSASSLRIIGSGIAENGFLSSVSGMIGFYRKKSTSSSRNRQGMSTSISYSKDEILDVSDLTAIPTGRAIFVHAGIRPILVKLVPWWERPYADELRNSTKKTDEQPPQNGRRRTPDVPLSDTAPQPVVPVSRWATK